MTNEELAIEIQNGNTEYLPVLFDQVEKFIRKKAAQRLRVLGEDSGIEFDELYDSGYLAVIEAAKYFKPESGYKFLTFLDKPLKNAFAEVTNARTQKGLKDPLRNAVSLETPVGEDETLTIGDTIADDTDITAEVIRKVSNKELHNALENALSMIKPNEEKAVRMKYYEGLNFEQIGDKLGVTASRAEQLCNNGLMNLRSPEIIEKLEKFVDIQTNIYLGVNTHSQQFSEKSLIIKRKITNTALNTHFDALRARCGLCT